MKTTTISKSAVKKVLIEILKEEPEILRGYVFEQMLNVATKDDIKAVVEMMKEGFENAKEERKSLREDLKLVVDMMDKRFESLIREMNARFEAMDKRFSLLTGIFLSLNIPLVLSVIAILLKVFNVF